MSESVTSFSFLVQNLEELALSGQIFGNCFYPPVLTDANEPPLIVSVLGAQDAGKSTFGEGSFSPLGLSLFKEDDLELTTSGVVTFEKEIQGAHFRFIDFGPQTYNSSDTWQYAMCHSHDQPLRSDLDVKRGIDYLEHPPLPHMAATDVAIFLSAPNNWQSTKIHFGCLELFLSEQRAFAQKTNAKRPLQQTLRENDQTFKIIQEQMHATAREIDNHRSYILPHENDPRLVTILLPKPREHLVERLMRFSNEFGIPKIKAP